MITNVINTDIKESSNLLNIELVLYFLIVYIIPVYTISRIQIQYKKFYITLSRNLLFVLLFLALAIVNIFLMYKTYSIFFRENISLKFYLTPSNAIQGVVSNIKSYISKNKVMQELFADARLTKKSKQRKLVVFVVGETARAQNFSIYGYNRDTNPLLSKRDIAVMNNTTSCGTYTALSVPCMFSSINSSEYRSTNDLYDTFLQPLLKLGISVFWLDNNFGGCAKVCNIDGISVSILDDQKDAKYCQEGECHDEILLRDLEAKINSVKSGDIFIVLHQNGSHGPSYTKRYPKKFEKFSPVCTNNRLDECKKDELLNAFDNTILYTDFTIDKTISILEKYDEKFASALFYASDHGESIGENGAYLHGIPYSIAPNEQKNVPFIVWLSKDMQKEINYSCVKNHGSTKNHSHDNIAHSILSIFDIESSGSKKDLDIFATCKK